MTLLRSRCALFAGAVLLLCLCGFLFFYRLAERDLWSSHEGRAAQDAETMLREGRWGIPRLFDDHADLQKPPLYYWLVAALAYLQGGNADSWVVRLPAALSGLACVLILFLFGSGRGRPLAGFLGAAMLATMVHFTGLARIGRIDMPLTLAVSSALFGFYQGIRAERGSWCGFSIAYVACAVAVLLKGPIGMILPAAVMGVFLCLEMRLAPRFKDDTPALRGEPPAAARPAWTACAATLWWGVPLMLGLSAPWFVWAWLHTDGELFRQFLWHHNVERAFGGSSLRAHEWWFYGPRLAVDLFPWSVLLPVAGKYFLRRGRWREDDEARFGLVWLLSIVVLLSCVRFKRADYLVPAYPGAALFLGCMCERWFREKIRATQPKSGLTLAILSLVLVVLGCVAGWWFYTARILPRDEPAREHKSFAAAIRRLVPTPGLVIFFRVEAHALAFHVGKPINTILEWENIDIWAGRPGSYYIVMPPECAESWQKHVTAGRLEVVLRNEDLSGGRHEQPLVLLKTVPRTARADVGSEQGTPNGIAPRKR